MAKFADRVKVSTPTTGQVTTISLGSAESGFQVVPTSLNGHTLRYVIEEGSAWEIGTAVYDSSGPSLTSRTLTSSSTGQLLSLSGSAKVFISASADDLDLLYADITVTVGSVGSYNYYFIDGTQQQTITLVPSVTYRFDVSSFGSNHPFKLATQADAANSSQFTTGVTEVGSTYVEVKLEQDAPSTLYYYCSSHNGMGGTINVGSTSYSNATTSADGLMSSADKTKLDGVATSANNYSLPTASSSTLGGIKIGTGLSIDGSGVVTASGSGGSATVNYSPAFVGARWKFTSTQSGIGSSGSILNNYTTRDYDTTANNDFTSTNSRLTVPAGVSRVVVKASAETSSVTSQTALKIYMNGGDIESTNIDIDSTGGDYVFATTPVIEVTQGDYFEAFLFSQNSRSVLADDRFTWFEIQVIEGSILNSVPQTVQPYDANLKSFTDTFTLPTSDGSANQVLKTDGSGAISFANQSGGIALTDLSVTQNSASGTGALSYNNSSGVFSYTPPASSSSTGGSLEPITTTKTVASSGDTVFTGTWKAENISVFLNGVKLQDSEVTATDTQITISATAAGDVVEVVEYGAPFASPYASTFLEPNAGETSVTVNYTPDKVAVYRNGVKLRGGGEDFTASNGTTITGFSAFVADDVVEVVEHGSLAESGGGVTTYANKAAIDAVSSPSEGDLAYDLAADQLYIRTTSDWKRVSAGTDESPIVTTEPASAHTLNSDGSTSTVTMVAEDPEGFGVTYGIAYPTASNALPNQLATATSINQSTGVFTFDPSTNNSHAGDVKVRLSASDGVSTTTRFCTLSLEFFGGVYGVHGDGTVIQADSNVTRSVYGSPSAVTDSAFAQQVLRLDSASTNKGVTFESLPSYSLNSDTGSKRIVYAVKIDTTSGASIGITHRDKDGNVLNFATANSNLFMIDSGSAGRNWSTNYWDQWIIVCPYAYNSNFTANSGDVTLRVKIVGSGTPSDVTLGGSSGYAAPTISNNNSMYFYSGAVNGVGGYTSRNDLEHSMGGLAVYPVSYGTVDQTIADFENALVG